MYTGNVCGPKRGFEDQIAEYQAQEWLLAKFKRHQKRQRFFYALVSLFKSGRGS